MTTTSNHDEWDLLVSTETEVDNSNDNELWVDDLDEKIIANYEITMKYCIDSFTDEFFKVNPSPNVPELTTPDPRYQTKNYNLPLEIALRKAGLRVAM